jgi:hypothetical protein
MWNFFRLGGTAKLLIKNRIPVIEVSNYTGFPKMMDGRVKTLHPKIHGAILERRGIDDDIMQQHQIASIYMVVVNLSLFSQTVAKSDYTLDDAVKILILVVRQWFDLLPKIIKMLPLWLIVVIMKISSVLWIVTKTLFHLNIVLTLQLKPLIDSLMQTPQKLLSTNNL